MAEEIQPLFSSFRPAKQGPAGLTPIGSGPMPAAAPAASAADAARMLALEKTVADLKAELAKIKEKPQALPPSSAAEAAADRTLGEASRPELKQFSDGVAKELARHLDRAWDAIEAYKAKAAAQDIRLGGTVKLIEEIYARVSGQEQRLTQLPDAGALEGLKQRLAGAEQLLAKAGTAEEIKKLEDKLAAQDERLNNSAAVAPAEAILSMRAEVVAVSAGFDEMKRKFSFYLEEFSSIERECRSSLGAVKGYVEKAESSPAVERLDGYIKDSFAQLEAKLAAAEVKLHGALGALAAKAKAEHEAYSRDLAALRQQVEGEVLPEIKAVAGSQAAVAKDSARLKEEYEVRTVNQLRDLEARYSAVSAVGKRVELLAEALEQLKKR